MERNVRYVWIGIIFFLVLIFMIAFILWLNRFEIDPNKYAIYYAYSSSEVEGIGTNTPIRYKGISVGRVRSVGFKDIKEGIIEIEMFIDSALLIQENAKVLISSQGLAGANYLALIQGNGGALKSDSENRKVLSFDKGGFEKIISKASELGDSADVLLKSLNHIVSEQNITEINAILKDIHTTTKHLQSLSAQMDSQMKNGEYNMREILTPTLLQLQGSLQDMSKFFTDASNFLSKIDKSPYDTLFGKESQKSTKDK
ncbi:MlaD family protein [Helicobacter marmotae]|uniref:MCE family protein n=1 Tax=Helicobacter marmotae TaxID=152490 RepID=A0A3D8I186_9HELI|nr:MlaD family protein [Helicobacter marmotae]RDU58898.1 MCE family protein [Helicobacter marmotae]